MSTESHASPYRRDCWWGRDRDDTAAGGHDTDRITAGDHAAWIAHKILKEQAPLHCGLAKQAGYEVELSPPEAFPPDTPVARQRPVRYNPIEGTLSGGFGTWVDIGDLPAAEFFEVVATCLELWQECQDLAPRETDRLRSEAKRLKRRDDWSDDEIIARLTLAVTSSTGTVFDYLD